jgi:hypothetical protein
MRLSLVSLQDLDQLFRRHFVCSILSTHTSRTDYSPNSHTLFCIFASHLSMGNGNVRHDRNQLEPDEGKCLNRRCTGSHTRVSSLRTKRSCVHEHNTGCLWRRFSALRIKLDFIGGRHECPQLSLLHWCLSVPEALTTGPISGEVRRRK